MSGPAGLAYEPYSFASRDEWLMRIGPAEARPILFVPPLLEEMNRTRALIAGTMRALAARGFGCWLVDLPGTGESERALEGCGWNDWTGGAAAAFSQVAKRAGKPPALAAIRGGCLLDGIVHAPCRWRLAPVPGASLVRDLDRAAQVGGGVNGGYPLAEELRQALAAAATAADGPVRTARLESDPAPADVKLPGPALWRRSEPDNSSELSDTIASDIEQWIGECGAC